MHYAKIDLLDAIEPIVFGNVSLSANEQKLYKTLNTCFLNLCRTLPSCMQNSAMFFLLNYFHLKVGEPLDFFKYYYKPIWTIIPCMMESGIYTRELTSREYETAMTGQAMALFLHSLDDHLNDGDIPASHLLLLLRSQAWLLFNKAVAEFADGKEDHDIADSLINKYYSGVCSENEPEGLDEYCARFKKEMSTVNIMPVLSARKITEIADFADGIKIAMESFGTAWRILDDIQDIIEDLAAGTHSAVYYFLSEQARKLWNKGLGNPDSGRISDAKIRKNIFNELFSGKILKSLSEKITVELEKAQKIANELGMNGLAEQYGNLGVPVKKWLSGL